MAHARDIRDGVELARAEIERTIAAETSGFRVRLFREELARLNTFARGYAERPSRFNREGLAAALTTVALYTLECVGCWPEGGGGIVTLDQAESMRRLGKVMAAARSLRAGGK